MRTALGTGSGLAFVPLWRSEEVYPTTRWALTSLLDALDNRHSGQ